MTSLKKILSRTAVVVALVMVLGSITVALIQDINKPPAADILDTRQYAGRILDSSTQLPISNAKVTLDLPGMIPQVAYTDNEGVYFYNLMVKDGQQNGLVSVEVTGYETYRRNVNLSSSILSMEEIRLISVLSIINEEPTSPPIPPVTPTEIKPIKYEYIVQAGDTLDGISKKFMGTGLYATAIGRANCKPLPVAGNVLIIRYYHAQKEENIDLIAKRFGSKPDFLRSINALDPGLTLLPADQILILHGDCSK